MKAITLEQPFASLVSIGAKTIETRPWPTPYRGALAIHSAKKFTPVEDSYYRSLLILDGLDCEQLPVGKVNMEPPDLETHHAFCHDRHDFEIRRA